MTLTLLPTGLGKPDDEDWEILDDGRGVGRIYRTSGGLRAGVGMRGSCTGPRGRDSQRPLKPPRRSGGLPTSGRRQPYTGARLLAGACDNDRMYALLSILMLVSTARAEVPFFEQSIIPACTMRYAHAKGAFIECDHGRLAGFLARYDQQYAGYLICRTVPGNCPPEIMTIFGPALTSPTGTRDLTCYVAASTQGSEPLLSCLLAPSISVPPR
jgi:hypothetical protein